MKDRTTILKKIAFSHKAEGKSLTALMREFEEVIKEHPSAMLRINPVTHRSFQIYKISPMSRKEAEAAKLEKPEEPVYESRLVPGVAWPTFPKLADSNNVIPAESVHGG